MATTFAALRAQLRRLQREYDDDGLYADPAYWPEGSADGPFAGRESLGRKTVVEAIELLSKN